MQSECVCSHMDACLVYPRQHRAPPGVTVPFFAVLSAAAVLLSGTVVWCLLRGIST